MHEDNVLRADLLNKLGVLSIVDMGSERNLLDGEAARYGSTLDRLNVIWLAQKCLTLALR